MSSSLCSSSSSFETKNLYFESLHFAKTSAPLPKSFVRPGRADGPQVANHVVHRAAVASHLAPKQLEKSIIEKRQLEEASKKIKFVRTLLIDNYDSYTYNVYQELSVINKVPPVVVRNDEWTWEEAYYFLYKQRAFDNIVISPGPGSPMHPSDIGLCLQLLLECKDIPILGVCLGHQALGFVHGAQIVHASEPIHGRLSKIEHDGCRLFHNIPSGTNSGFKVVRYHSLVIDGRSLPKELVPIAWTSTNDTLAFLETSCLIPNAYNSKTGERLSSDSLSIYPRKGCSLPSHYVNGSHREKVLMGIRHATRPHFGLQFHPESVATSHGRKMFTNFRDITVDYWKGVASSSRNNHHNGNRNSHNDSTSVSHAGQLPSAPRNRQLSDHEDGSSPSWMQNALSTSQSSVGVKNLKLRWKKLECLADKVGGTRNIFCELFGACKGEETFWLDSSSVEKGRARFSFMGKRGGPLWKQFSFRLPKQSDVTYKNGGFLSIEDAEGATTTKYLENGFLDFLNQELQSFHCDEEDYQGLPFDFCGGFIGYIGYNLKVECGAASNCHESSSPDACFFFADDLIVIDHHYTDVYILSMHEKCSSPTPWLDKTEQKLLGLRTSSLKYIKEDHSKTHLFSPFEAGFISDKSRDQYIQDVKKCLRYIKDGESYELCLTTQMRKKIGKVDPLGLYLRLREQNPAPYAAWLNFSKENLSICCSSPERFLRLDKDGVLEAKPIKGTISRGSTPQQDEEHRFRLQYSEKDQAENLMIVDLLRNDLGRVCEPGSVHVPHLMEVETYASVHTMVSTIRGEKREDMGPVECIRATFPGGSMTGAPKLRSMEILDSLESCSRGVYSGSIGYFSINGTFDLNIVIRTVVVHENEASLGAGGAIVALSRPEDEYEEMILKTRAPTTAIVACQNDS